MSPDIVPARDRTADCAAGSEHGSVAVQAVPVPEGEAWRGVVAAEAGGAVASAAATTATATRAVRRRAAGNEDVDKRPPEVRARRSGMCPWTFTAGHVHGGEVRARARRAASRRRRRGVEI